MGNRLMGRRAIVTGAASGIGLATAKLFVAQGAQVLGVDMPGQRLTDALAGTQIAALGVSVTQADAPRIILDAAVAHMGGLDIEIGRAHV